MPRVVLGRGLSALIPNKNKDNSALQRIQTGKITANENQPRKFFEDTAFQELKESVKQFGVLQPLIVKAKSNSEGENFELIAGERRYRAAVAVGIQEIPCVVKNVKSDIEGFEIALIENIQREDLNPLEEARAYRYLLDDCNISQDKLAKQLGKSRSYIANSVRLLNLDEPVQQLVGTGKLSAGHARALVTLEPAKQSSLAKRAVDQGLSVRQLENIVGNKPNTKTITIRKFDDYSELQQQLSRKMDAKVRIKSQNDKGHIEIYFNDGEELKNIKNKLINN